MHTDFAGIYRTFGKEMVAHHVVSHHIGQYISELSEGTNKAENIYSQLKRSISGTHHNLSPEHLHHYLSEFAYRHSNHAISDTERMARLMTQIHGPRLTYQPLING